MRGIDPTYGWMQVAMKRGVIRRKSVEPKPGVDNEADARDSGVQSVDRALSIIETLAEDDEGLPCGFCQLYPSFCSVEAAPIFVLYDLYVTPAARRSGTGRALLLAAEARARAEGRVRMDLTTAHSNHTAQRLYESLGWVHDEVFRTYNRRITR